MTPDQAAWVTAKEQQLNEQVQAYPQALQSLVEASYLQSVWIKLPLLPEVQASFAGFQDRVEALLSTLPPVEGVKHNSFSQYLQELGAFRNFIRETYHLVPEGYYKKKWMSIGIALGICYGLLFKNLALGMLLGLALGIAIGTGKDRKAEKENRVL